MGPPENKLPPLGLAALVLLSLPGFMESKCTTGCDLALASYCLWQDCTLSFISRVFNVSIDAILAFNRQISDPDIIVAGDRVNVPFTCNCIDGEFLAHRFLYSFRVGASYGKVASTYLSNLTTVESLLRINTYPADFVAGGRIPFIFSVNCSCGDRSVSGDYGLFLTYPLRLGEDLSSVARDSELPLQLLQRYNRDAGWVRANHLVFIPAKDQHGKYPSLQSSGTGISRAVIVGASMGICAVLVLLALCLYVWFHKRKAVIMASSKALFIEVADDSGHGLEKIPESAALVDGTPPHVAPAAVNKAIEYSYKELAEATDNFSIANQIGNGGFGAVFYAELRGQKAAIKKMDLQASKVFLAELHVLAHVHHVNLVRLLGYCAQRSLCLVYEFIENGNLSQHLHCTGTDPLPWSTRLQIALDSARGLQYIHEHTTPTYIHRDVKPANILIGKNFHAKVADFGLTKLADVGGLPLNSHVAGTFGYMPPEYAQYGEVSPKVDVYAFGVLLYELLSAKNAVLKTGDDLIHSTTGLISLFESSFSKTDPSEDLYRLVDPRMRSDCPMGLIHKLALLARACTQEKPQLRPDMRSIVVALTMLMSSSFEDYWGVATCHGS